MHHAVCESVLDHVGNVFFEAQISRLEDRRMQKRRSRELLQCGYSFVPVGGLEFENGLQSTGELAAFLNERVLKASHGENGNHLGGWLRHLQQLLIALHLTPILEQYSQAGGTEKCRLAEIHIDGVDFAPDCKNVLLQPVGSFPVDTPLHPQLNCVPGDKVLYFHIRVLS